MGSLNITGGQINITDDKKYHYLDIFGESIQLYLTDSEIINITIIATNIEVFGKPWWEKFKLKMKQNISIIDSYFVQVVDKNIDWWTRDKIIEKVLQ